MLEFDETKLTIFVSLLSFIVALHISIQNKIILTKVFQRNNQLKLKYVRILIAEGIMLNLVCYLIPSYIIYIILSISWGFIGGFIGCRYMQYLIHKADKLNLKRDLL